MKIAINAEPAGVRVKKYFLRIKPQPRAANKKVDLLYSSLCECPAQRPSLALCREDIQRQVEEVSHDNNMSTLQASTSKLHLQPSIYVANCDNDCVRLNIKCFFGVLLT